jgi:integrase
MATRRSARLAKVGDRSATTNCTLTDTKTGAPAPVGTRLHGDPITADDRRCVVFASRSGETPIVGYRKMSLRIAKLGDLPADITPHVLRHHFASLTADLGYNETTIASLLGQKTHSITSRYMHSADAVLLAAADAVANATMKLMTSDQAQPQLRISAEMQQSRGTESPLYR